MVEFFDGVGTGKTTGYGRNDATPPPTPAFAETAAS
jgi:hypothetical protein